MTYPTPGSLGADLFEMTEQEYVERFGQSTRMNWQLPEELNAARTLATRAARSDTAASS